MILPLHIKSDCEWSCWYIKGLVIVKGRISTELTGKTIHGKLPGKVICAVHHLWARENTPDLYTNRNPGLPVDIDCRTNSSDRAALALNRHDCKKSRII